MMREPDWLVVVPMLIRATEALLSKPLAFKAGPDAFAHEVGLDDDEVDLFWLVVLQAGCANVRRVMRREVVTVNPVCIRSLLRALKSMADADLSARHGGA